jgi:hypothetical protein
MRSEGPGYGFRQGVYFFFRWMHTFDSVSVVPMPGFFSFLIPPFNLFRSFAQAAFIIIALSLPFTLYRRFGNKRPDGAIRFSKQRVPPCMIQLKAQMF